MPFVDHLFYEQSGSGQPVLFVHGWCMSAAVWSLQRTVIADHHRFLALDLRGHGKSTTPPGGVGGFAGYANDIVQLSEQLNLQRMIVVGWSLGAQAVLKAYPRLRDRLAGLVLVGATPRFTSAPHFPFGLASKEAEGMQLKVRRNLERALSGFQHNLFAEQELHDPALAKQASAVLSQVRLPSHAAALEGLEALMDEEVMGEACQVSCPTLLFHGEQDRICLPDASSWLEQSITGSRRICYKDCGHAPFLSRPQQFNHDLMHFIGECCAIN
jgi:pimeloyl-[acyl-carrier protein] methyl ester esterase